ncbi:hypothetical protein EVAR_80336_1 [Eumeta japonica]|uniref:Uncharacterized protein n=1 Tax=Eumeta variegata TaxID=151549 RepID=A0A4C1X2K9_EUMVA|nr:hypothetical protein EVAR_80336_1 [Eumeta japonica]
MVISSAQSTPGQRKELKVQVVSRSGTKRRQTSRASAARLVTVLFRSSMLLAINDEFRKELPLSFLLVLLEGKLPSERADVKQTKALVPAVTIILLTTAIVSSPLKPGRCDGAKVEAPPMRKEKNVEPASASVCSKI